MGGLSLLSVAFVVLGYISALIFFGGLFYKLWGYAVTPSPLNIPVTPQPKTLAGVILKNFRIILTFESLFKANKWTWIGGYALHLILLMVLLRHLRYFVEPLGSLLTLIQPLGVLAGLLMPLPLIYLWIHRKTVDRLNYITSGADIFALVLLLLIALSGITLRLLYHPDVAAVKQFMLSMVLLSPVNIPTNPIFLIHFSLVIVLGIYFPFSKLLHAGGVFFSPTRTQIENVREVRYINPWASSGEKS